MTKILSFQLSDEEYKALESVAKTEDRSKGYLVRQCLNQYLQDYMDVKHAQKISKEIAAGKRKVVDWKDVKKDLFKD